MTQEQNLLSGSVPKKLIAFALPLLLANILQSFYNVVDMLVVGQFVGANSAGVQFPTPAPAAYQTINAEFPNGVVQSATEMQSQTGQQLYNNNYNRIKNIFITAHLGGFFIVLT